jgi:hypothetical protein
MGDEHAEHSVEGDPGGELDPGRQQPRGEQREPGPPPAPGRAPDPSPRGGYAGPREGQKGT